MTNIGDLPEFPRISDYLFHWAEQRPDQVAVTLGSYRLNYAEAAQRVSALSRALIALGVSRGDRVAMLCTPRPEFFLTFLATADIGAIWVGLNPRYRFEEMSYVLGDCQPKLFFSLTGFEDRDYTPDLARLTTEHPVVRLITIGGQIAGALQFDDQIAWGAKIDDSNRSFARMAVNGKDPASIVYTSGTTGEPKGALLKHYGLVYAFRRQLVRMGVSPMIAACDLSINHIGGAGDLTCMPLISGGTIHFMERFEASRLLELIERERINYLGQVPTIYQFLVSCPQFDTTDLSSLQLMMWSGAAMPKSLIESYQRRFRGRLMVTYGQTESICAVTYSDDDADLDTLLSTVGKPDPELNVRLMAEDGHICGINEEGEIQLRHECVMAGYFNKPAATAAAFTADGYLRTGDVGVLRPDGNLRVVGRIKEMYKSGGYNVYPREIEMCLEGHPSVAMVAVISVSDPIYQEVGHAYVLAQEGKTPTPEELTGWCRERLANYKVPKRIIVADNLPMLPTRKIDKRLLKRQASSL